MKVWGEQAKGSAALNQQKNNVTKQPNSNSNNSQDFQAILRAIKLNSGAANDTVKELGKKYTAGNYNVDSRELANRILQTIRLGKIK
ncbi:MAG: flagellar biosynthesis anti-sigma factor FlgM [Bacillota bacterium]|nr:flagellar biosynthesis anti-sigma factor FlgM [Bacillota bacterium]